MGDYSSASNYIIGRGLYNVELTYRASESPDKAGETLTGLNNYIHFNPVHPKWKLAGEPRQYKYSSAKLYYEDIDEFGILENYMDVLRDS